MDRIYNSGVTKEASLPIEFFFVSDDEEKLKRLGLFLLSEFPQYTHLSVEPYDENFKCLALLIQSKWTLVRSTNGIKLCGTSASSLTASWMDGKLVIKTEEGQLKSKMQLK